MRATDHVYVLSGSYYSPVLNRDLLGEVYGIRTEQGMILIDCGRPETGLLQIDRMLDYYQLGVPVTHLLLTHAHYDHCGSAKALQQRGALVVAGAEDLPQCQNGGTAGYPTPFQARDDHAFPAFTPDITVDRDCAMDFGGLTFEFIKTPGHTPGSMCIRTDIDRKKVLFTGDVVQPQGSSTIETVGLGWQGDVGFSRENIVKSMLKLDGVEADVLLPGHGKICMQNGGEVLHLAAQTAFLTLR